MRLISHTGCFVSRTDTRFFKFIVCASVLLAFQLLGVQKTQAQVVNPSISFSIGPCTLDVALEELFADYEVKVAFSKAELSLVEIDAYACSYKPLDEVLSDLLRNTGFGYKKIGRQYVIKRMPVFEPIRPENQTNDPAVPSRVENHKVDTVLNRSADTIRIYDTLFVTRILLQRDTITKINTVVQHDTTYIRKRNPLEFNWPSFRNNGWSLNLSYQHEWGRFEKSVSVYHNDMSLGLFEESVGMSHLTDGISAELGNKNRRLNYGVTLTYCSLRFSFAAEHTMTQGDCYMNDTLDSYYMVNPSVGDTTFFYIVDSVYVPLEVTRYSFSDINRLNYFGMGGFCSFDFLSLEYFRMFVKAGFSIDFLLNANGTTYGTETPYQLVELEDQAARVKFCYHAGLGAALKVGQRMELVPEFGYHGRIGSLLREEYPLGLKSHSFAIKIGLTYYF